MRAVLLLVGLSLALALPVRAADAPAAVWSAEAGAASGWMVLVWPSPARTTLVADGNLVRLRAERPLPDLPASVVHRLSRWLQGATMLGRGAELVLKVRQGAVVRLAQPQPRLGLIELAEDVAPIAPVAMPAKAAGAVATIEPAAGGTGRIPVPRSRPDPNMAQGASEPEPVPVHTEPDHEPNEPPAVAAEAMPGVTVSADVRRDGLELRFRWGRAVPAAIFERGAQLWVVFPGGDAPVAGWRSLARNDVAAWLEPIATTNTGGARAFRFRLPRAARIEPRADASGWAIAVRPSDGVPEHEPVEPAFRRVPESGELIATTEGEVVQLREPDTGGRLGVLLTPPGGLRQPDRAMLVDLELLPSLHGLVWRPLADGVRGSVASGRLTITRPGGLRLFATGAPPPKPPPDRQTTDAADDRRAPRAASPPPAPRVNADTPTSRPHELPEVAHAGQPSAGGLGLASLGRIDAAARWEQRRRLVGELLKLTGLPRAKARLELARLYLADALGPEARTALALIDEAELAPAAATPLRTRRIALTGAAEALSGRHDPALASLLDHVLDGDPEIALWRAYAAAQAARWPLATQEWERSGGLPESYPEPLRRRLGLEMATMMLEHGEAAEARALMAQLGEVALPATEAARLRLLEGIAFGRDGRPTQAAAAFAEASAAGDPDTATRAAFLLASGRAERGESTPAAEVAVMQSDRSRWRGHPWELRMLGRLAELQAAAGRPSAAIATRREALARMAEPDAAAARAELRRDLAAQLADGTVSPLRRLALYRAHGDLLESDPAAPGLRRALAEGAARAGLTDTAASLLDAAGPPAEAGDARTVLVSTLAARGDTDQALRRLGDAGAVESTAVAGLRAELRARTALAAGDVDRAAQALAEAGPTAGTRLAREIAWRRGAWDELAQAAGADLGAAGDGKALGRDVADAAIWLGLAQSRSGRTAEAAAVADRYGKKLAEPGDTILLRLATVPMPSPEPEGALAATARLIDEVRADLAALPALADGGGSVRTASARSGPEG